MDTINKSSEDKLFKNHDEDNSNFKDVENGFTSNGKEKKDENLILNPKDNTVLLKDIQHIVDVSVNLSVKLGQAKIKIKDLLNISIGSVLILDKLIGESLDIFVNESLMAQGEIVVVENKYGIRIISIVNSSKI
ncbi:flagellar motor switch protein FliN [Buchnera aphidicola (Pemphigus obesinymphae)]|uniref:flagellar motor switch protein FliN n=1 Tax=Buchnera aphidicola TaxID=9 RepID=UPI00223799C8|nr:flagellar motor switch protein FliN [Buchnera aphidicola]MCW5196515.1 flagellar motor switch protein FliN [Buchnera aphidicola (Pemphigus obesinymphae)]